jgi:hypothetical protein
MTDSTEITITAVDGTDALAFVIIRPGETEGGVSIEAAAKGLSKPSAAYVLRHVANMWDPEGLPAELLADLERARGIAVALEQENAHLTAELAEEKASRNPLLRCLIVKPDRDKDMYVGWSNGAEAPTGVWSRETAIAYGFPPSRLDRADENGSSDTSCGDGHWDDWGFIAEQRGTLRRDRLGEYAVEYLNGDRQAAYGLLEPFEDESEVRK